MAVPLGQGRPALTGKQREIAGAPPLRARYFALWSGLALTLLIGGALLVLWY